MFNTIKDKFLNVTKSVQLFTSNDNNNIDNKKQKIDQKNMNIGGRILQNFETSWMEIHNLNEENAKKAASIADDTEMIANKIDKYRETVGQIIYVFTNSNIITNVKQCRNNLENISDLCNKVENMLYDLENFIDESEFENMKRQHLLHLNNYKIKKNESLNNLKQKLNQQHEQKIKDHEANKQFLLEERQKVFQEAFKADLETYKNLGTIPKINLPSTKKKNVAILEEIQLDLDNNELENFFNDNSGESSSSSSKPNNN